MTIDEAVELLELESTILELASKKGIIDDDSPKLREAVRLGIEALEAIKVYRKEYLTFRNNVLPGETE